ncbi:MAG: arylsulfatase [Bacteroidota bacterium]
MSKYLFCLLPLFVWTCRSTTEEPPNIVLILADDLGWSDIGSYGSEVKTPHLDHLAENGLRFTQFYNTAKCFPSRACLLTGVYAQDCGYDRTYINPIQQAVTIGEVLRRAGYRTYWSGKHHGVENPITIGFDRYYGLKDGACNHFNPGSQRPDEAQPAQKRNNRSWCIDSLCYVPYTPESEDFYTTDYFTNYGLEFLEDAKAHDQPFLLYLAYTAPHDPLMAWTEDIEKYEGIYDEGYTAIREARFERQRALGMVGKDAVLSEAAYADWDTLDATSQQFEIDKMEVYAAMIDRMDQNIGRVLQKLESLDLEDNTLIIFVSDNGASAEVVNLSTDNDTATVGTMDRWVSLGSDWANVSNTPFRFYKNYSYEGGVRTPMIAYWKDHIEANAISDFPGHFIDLMPTFIELAQTEYPKDTTLTPLRGESLVPALLDGQQERTQPLFWQWQAGSAVRKDNWKIVRHGVEGKWELYDLESDPDERENMATTFPNQVSQLDSLYQNWWFSNEVQLTSK